MSEQGVPVGEATAEDFIMVRAALVKRLGGANEALVWERIRYRCARPGPKQPLERWEGTYQAIGEEVGLTARQVQRAVDTLVERGYLERAQLPSRNRVYSYLVVIIGRSHETKRSDGPSDQTVPQSDRTVTRRATERSLAPLIDIQEEEDTPIVPTATPDDLFAMAWANWPKKTDKKLSRERFLRALTKRPSLADDVCRFGIAYRTTPVQFVPALAVWIGRERWTDDLPVPRGGKPTTMQHGANVHDILAARAQQKAVAR